MDRITRFVMQSWVAREEKQHRNIPWTRLSRPLSSCRLACLSSAGLALKDDPPFDQEGERRNPWWGDPTHRVLPRGTRAEDIEVYHLHIHPKAIRQDMNVCLPLDRAEELVHDGVLGSLAPSHYAIMGYLLDAGRLLEETVPKIIARLREEAVDAVLLIPL